MLRSNRRLITDILAASFSTAFILLDRIPHVFPATSGLYIVNKVISPRRYISTMSLSIPQKYVHLWIFDAPAFPMPTKLRESLENVISQEEKEVANNRIFEKDREDYISCRAFVRNVISMYTNLEPQDLVFEKSTYGKPYLCDIQNSTGSPLTFNWSNAGNLSVIALTCENVMLGVDVEMLDRKITKDVKRMLKFLERMVCEQEFKQYADLVNHHKRSFSTDSQFEALESEKRAFSRLWTRKEAFIKATGEGLSRGLKSFMVDVAEESPKLISVDGNIKEAREWSLIEFQVNAFSIGTIAVRWPETPRVETKLWNPWKNRDQN